MNKRQKELAKKRRTAQGKVKAVKRKIRNTSPAEYNMGLMGLTQVEEYNDGKVRVGVRTTMTARKILKDPKEYLDDFEHLLLNTKALRDEVGKFFVGYKVAEDTPIVPHLTASEKKVITQLNDEDKRARALFGAIREVKAGTRKTTTKTELCVNSKAMAKALITANLVQKGLEFTQFYNKMLDRKPNMDAYKI